jgi:hypothetical protein
VWLCGREGRHGEGGQKKLGESPGNTTARNPTRFPNVFKTFSKYIFMPIARQNMPISEKSGKLTD